MNRTNTTARRTVRRAAGTVILLALIANTTANAQMERRRSNPSAPVGEIFWAPTVINVASATNLPARNANFSIHHTFGLTNTGYESLWGLDDPANIRFGLDYGIVDRLSVGFGRSRFDKLWDFRFKASLLRQTIDDKMPIELAVKGDLGINTVSNPDFEFIDRLNYLGSVMIARKVSDRISLQVTPMFAHFNTVIIESDGEGGTIEPENSLFAVGLDGRFVLSDRFALLVEYIPVVGDRNPDTKNAFSVGLDIETGGHVFQLFLTSSQWTTEQHTIARNTDNFFKGDFRLGFNVNRVFGL